MNIDERIKLIEVAAGRKKAELTLKNARVINVFTGAVESCDVAIHKGLIAGVGSYSGEYEVDLQGGYLCPGFIDGHIHLESSMIAPAEFERAVLPHGTTAVVTDPHELANVCGLQGIEYILQSTAELTLDCFLTLPSCVPATALDESGASLDAAALAPYFKSPRVLGLAEMMNSFGTVNGERAIIDKLCAGANCGKLIDGHAPGLGGNELNAYVAAGVASDHECSDLDEALAKLARGQYIMIREGTAAHNLAALLPLLREPYCERCMLVSDDKHPGELLSEGHMDAILRKAVALGADPITAIKLATYTPALYFGLTGRGAVAPGYVADLVVLSDLERFEVEQVYKGGRLVCSRGEMLAESPEPPEKSRFPGVYNSFNMQEITARDFELDQTGDSKRVIALVPGEVLTEELILPFNGGVETEKDIIKLAVLERHHNTGHIGLGYLGGYGLKRGAVASSVAHDSHNLIVAGANDADMALAGNTVRGDGGGIAFAVDGRVVARLPLPIGGLMSELPAADVQRGLDELKAALAAHGVGSAIDPLMTLAFVSLPVIPKLRLNTLGLIDTRRQQVVPAVFYQLNCE